MGELYFKIVTYMDHMITNLNRGYRFEELDDDLFVIFIAGGPDRYSDEFFQEVIEESLNIEINDFICILQIKDTYQTIPPDPSTDPVERFMDIENRFDEINSIIKNKYIGLES